MFGVEGGRTHCWQQQKTTGHRIRLRSVIIFVLLMIGCLSEKKNHQLPVWMSLKGIRPSANASAGKKIGGVLGRYCVNMYTQLVRRMRNTGNSHYFINVSYFINRARNTINAPKSLPFEGGGGGGEIPLLY